jgi:hypothetical protein
MSSTIEMMLEGHVGPDSTRTYQDIPFAVPPHTVRIDVHYAYSDQIGSDPGLTAGNTVDIGIFDVRGHEFMGAGFRGWSGSARESFFIARDDATPGYLAGPIQAGTWAINLGFYKVWHKGCHYRVTVRLTVDESVAGDPGEFLPLLPLRTVHTGHVIKAEGWYKGELHCHSQHSDGDGTPLEIVRLAEQRGLDFLALTDHNNQSQQAVLNTIETDLMLIPGFEVTTYYGHWNIWGAQGWIDFRVQAPEHLQAAIDEAVRRGYLVSCNHPRPEGPDWEFREVGGYHCIEVWNGPWQFGNEHCLRFWESKLRQGQRLPAVGGSDTHFLHRTFESHLGYPTTYIYVEGQPSPAALLDGLRAGHAFVTYGPDGPCLDLRSGDHMMGDQVQRPASGYLPLQIRIRDGLNYRLQVIGADGILFECPITEDEVTINTQLTVSHTPYLYARLIVDDPDHFIVTCLTNPLYFSM